MLQALQVKRVGLGYLLLSISVGLFGCVSGLDLQTGSLDLGELNLGFSTQGIRADVELIGTERDIALQTALRDWRVQRLRSLLKSEGKQLDLNKAQAFSFKRGFHEGTVVLLPFGDKLLSYMQFRERNSVMLMAHRPGGAEYRVINDSQERQDLLQELQAKGAFHWLEEQFKKKGRALVPGLTLLLKDDSQGEVVFFVFTKPGQANSSGLTAQLVFLDPGDGEAGGGGSFYYTGDSSTTSTAELDPGIGGGGWVSLYGFTDVNGTVSHSISIFPPGINANVNASGTHTSVTDAIVRSISVSGTLTFSAATPKSCSKSSSYANSATCSTSISATVFIPVGTCTILTASGSSEHSYFDPTKSPSYGFMSSSGSFTFTFNC